MIFWLFFITYHYTVPRQGSDMDAFMARIASLQKKANDSCGYHYGMACAMRLGSGLLSVYTRFTHDPQ